MSTSGSTGWTGPACDHQPMSASGDRSRLGRPYRRLRRWARHTPNGDVAITLMSLGVALIFAALIIALFVL